MKIRNIFGRAWSNLATSCRKSLQGRKSKRVMNYWNRLAPEWSERDPEIKEFTKDVLRRQNIAGRVLDLMAGSEHYLSFLPDVVSLDISNEMLKRNPNEVKVQANIDKREGGSNLPFASGSFDFVTMINGISYIKKPEEFFIEAKRVLREGGKLVIFYSEDFVSKKAGKIPLPENVARQLDKLGFSTTIKKYDFNPTHVVLAMFGVKFPHCVVTATKKQN